MLPQAQAAYVNEVTKKLGGSTDDAIIERAKIVIHDAEATMLENHLARTFLKAKQEWPAGAQKYNFRYSHVDPSTIHPLLNTEMNRHIG